MPLPADRNPSGITAVASFSGRAWYAGASPEVIDGDDRSPNIGTFVFFTQIIDSKNKYDRCYQEADPTSETISDLVDSDGGFIVVAGAHRIFKMVALQSTLVIFADNGVWQILGGEGGFSATGFQVGKVTDVPADSKRSIVAAENVVFFWAKGGIYVLTPSDITPALRPTNLTDRTIQEEFVGIPSTARQNAVGFYDKITKEVRWLYSNDVDYDGVTFRFKYNRELIFNTVLSAFHIYTLSNDVTAPNTGPSPIDKNEAICAYVETDITAYTPVPQQVVINGVDVVIECVPVVIPRLQPSIRTDTSIKYLTLYEGSVDQEFSFANYKEPDFLDWVRDDAKGRLITGYDSFGDTQRGKQLDHLVMHCHRTEQAFTVDELGNTVFDNPSGLDITFKWNWSEDDNDTQDDEIVEGYRLQRQFIPDGIDTSFDYPYKVVSTQLKPKGKGKVFSMKIETQLGRDAHILGWGVSGRGEGRPSASG